MHDTTGSSHDESEPGTTGITRRTIVRGAAWSVPVIAAATAVPLASASTTCSLAGLQPLYVIRPSSATISFDLQLTGAGAGRTVSLSVAPAPDDTTGGGGGETGGNADATPPAIVPGPSVTTGADGRFSFQVVGQGEAGRGDFVLTIDAGTCGSYTTLIHIIDPATNNLRFWGYGGYGNIGDGTYQSRYIPTSPAFPSSMVFTDVAGSYLTSFAVRSDGTLYAWGWNGYQQFGTATPGLSNTPVEVPLPSGVRIARVLDTPYVTSLAIGTDGRLYSWGYNGYGATGQSGATVGVNVPVAPVTGLSNVTDAAGSAFGGVAIDGGVVKTWGYNASGQIGNGPAGAAYYTTPTEVTYFANNGIEVVDVAASTYAHYAVSADGDLYSWGYDGFGALGNGTGDGGANVYTPTPIPKVDGKNYVKVWANYYTVFALLDDGSLVAWGHSEWGKLGNGSLTGITYSPVPAFQGVTGVVDVAISNYGSYVRTASGDVYFAGYAGSGQSGNGGVGGYYTTPVKVFREDAATDIGATYWGAGEVLAS